MKPLLTILLILFVNISQSQSAEEKIELTDAQIAAAELCNCLNSFLNEIHPKIVTLIIENAQHGLEKAEENFFSFFETASSEEKLKILEDYEKFENIDSILDKRCENAVMILEQNDNFAFFEAIRTILNNKPECELISSILNSIDLGQY